MSEITPLCIGDKLRFKKDVQWLARGWKQMKKGDFVEIVGAWPNEQNYNVLVQGEIVPMGGHHNFEKTFDLKIEHPDKKVSGGIASIEKVNKL